MLIYEKAKLANHRADKRPIPSIYVLSPAPLNVSQHNSIATLKLSKVLGVDVQFSWEL